MSDWVECNYDGKSIFVNLNQVVSMARNGQYTYITYSALDGGTIVVSDTPEEILERQS